MNRIRPLPNRQRIAQVVDYDPPSGIFTWQATLSNRAQSGKVAGSLDHQGYVVIRIDGVLYRAHRLAWLIMTGASPTELIDHRNGNRADNRWDNLREASHTDNMCNSKVRSHNRSGVKGVRRLKSGRWNVRIRVDKREYGLGTFDTAEEAHAVYAKAAEDMHGEFARIA